MKGLILIYIVTAFATVGALRYPLLGLYTYVGFAVLRPQSIWGWAGDLSGLSLLIGWSMLAGWALQGFGSWSFGRGRLPVTALLLYVAWFALAGELGINPEGSQGLLVQLSKVIVPVLVGVTMLREKRQWMTLLWIIVLAQGYVGLEMHIDYYLKGRNTASYGFGTGDNNFFGLSLVTVLGPAAALAITSKPLYQRLAAAAAAALILHTTLLTFSRGAFVGLLAVAATAIVMMPKRPKNLAAIILAVGLAVWLTGPELAARYRSTFESAETRDGSAQSRLELWRSCLVVIGDYPILGIGPGSWTIVARQYGWPSGKSAHSIWMETAADTGVPGALLLLAFFGLTGVRLWPIARARPTAHNREEIGMATGGVLAVTGFVVTGQFVTAPAMEVPYYIVMAAVAMLRPGVSVAMPAGQSSGPPAPPRHPAPRVPLTGAPAPASLARRPT